MGLESAEKPLIPRKTVETYPPFFLGHFPSGSDNGRDRPIKARSGLHGSVVILRYPGIPERFSGEILWLVQIHVQG